MIYLLDGQTLEPVGEPIAGLSAVLGSPPWDIAFSADDRYLLTTADGIGRLWDLDSRQRIGDPIPTAGTFRSGAYHSNPHSDALRLATADAGRVYAWTLEPDRWPELACRAAGRNLTLGEWEQFGHPDQPYQATCSNWPALN